MLRFLLIIAIIFSNLSILNSQIINKENFELQEMTGNKKKLKELREKWENELNSIEEGVSWKVINQESLYSKYLSRNKSNSFDKYLVETLADGKINGEWIEKGSNNQAGRMHYVDVDFENDLLYAASSGGHVWRASMEGNDWTCLNNSIEFNNIQFVKIMYIDNKRRILAAAYGSSTIWITDDEGENWTQASGIESLSGWNNIKRTVVANNQEQTVYVLRHYYSSSGSYSYIYRSNDKGATFEKIYESKVSASQCDLWATRYDNDKVYFLRANQLFEINDLENPISTLPNNAFQDANPTRISNIYLKGAELESNIELAVMIQNPARDYTNIYSKDQGQNWTISTTKQTNGLFMVNSFGNSTYSVDAVFFGSVDLYRSFDGSSSWSKVSNWYDYYPDPENKLHADICGVQFFRKPESTEEIMYISTDGGIFTSDDYAFNVKNISLNGLRVGQYYDIYTAKNDRNYIHLGAQDQGYQLCKTDSGGVLDFEQIISGDYGNIVSGDGGSTVWTVYPGFLLGWINTFTNSRQQVRWNFVGSNWAWMAPTASLPNDPKSVYLIGGNEQGNSVVWKININPQYELASSIISPDMKSEFDVRLGSIYVNSKNQIYLGTNNGKFIKYTGGQSWDIYTIQNDPTKAPYTYCSDIIEDENRNIIYVSSSGYSSDGFYFSTDGGNSWTASVIGLPNTNISELAISDDGKMVFAATRVGPYVYFTEDQKWYNLAGSNTPETDYRSVEYIPESKTIRFATYGRGAWDLKIDKINTVKSNELNHQFITKSYPNPTKNNSNLTLQVKKSNYFVINVYNNQGIKVKQIYEGYLEQGSHEFNWNLTDGSLSALTSGVYYYTISSEGLTNYEKIIIQR